MSDYDKERVIHDYLVRTVIYDHESLTSDEQIARQADRVIQIEDGKIVRDEMIRHEEESADAVETATAEETTKAAATAEEVSQA